MNIISIITGFTTKLHDFGINKVCDFLYLNSISRRSEKITDLMWEVGPNTERKALNPENIGRSLVDLLFLGLPNLSRSVTFAPETDEVESKEKSFIDQWIVCPSKRFLYYTVIPVVDGALKVVYNAFAFVGNIFRALGNLFSGFVTGDYRKFKVCLGFAGINLFEIVRNSLRAIPIAGQGLAKIFSLVLKIEAVYVLVWSGELLRLEAYPKIINTDVSMWDSDVAGAAIETSGPVEK